MNPKLETVLKTIDERNAEDPKSLVFEGQSHPSEWVYSRRLTHWVLKLNAAPSDPLRIAASGQHIQRWKIPRDSYPMDRGGYLRWREELKKFHASTVAEIMTAAGYSQAEVQRTSEIIRKKNLAADSDVKTIEDALCLVFLELQFDELKAKTPADKMKEIVRKTWKKMSERGQKMALEMNFSPENLKFLQESLVE